MYLDPGLGGMLIQLVVAIVATGGAVAFMLRKKIKAFFSGKKEDAPLEQNAEKAKYDEDDAVDMLPDDK